MLVKEGPGSNGVIGSWMRIICQKLMLCCKKDQIYTSRYGSSLGNIWLLCWLSVRQPVFSFTYLWSALCKISIKVSGRSTRQHELWFVPTEKYWEKYITPMVTDPITTVSLLGSNFLFLLHRQLWFIPDFFCCYLAVVLLWEMFSIC